TKKLPAASPKKPDPAYKLSLEMEEYGLANDPFALKTVLMRDSQKLLSGRFELSMGDGTYYRQGRTGDVRHVYRHDGSCVIILEYYRNFFDTEPFLKVRKKVDILSGLVTIAGVADTGSITLENLEDKELDLAGWSIEAAGQQFVFDCNTI